MHTIEEMMAHPLHRADEETAGGERRYVKKALPMATSIAVVVGLLGLLSSTSGDYLSSPHASHRTLKQQQSYHRQLNVDPNTLVTDVDHLPAVVQDPSSNNEVPTETSQTTPTTISSDLFPSEELQRSVKSEQEEPVGYRHPASYFSDHYLRRALNSRRTIYEGAWGSWTFQDPNPSNRQSPEELENLLKKYPNRDIPRADFPANAWQVDQAYLEPWLKESIELTERSLKAILAEYGHYDVNSGMSIEDAMLDADKNQNAYMFSLRITDHGCCAPRRRPIGLAGLASPSALARMKRLLLHAVMTQDKFFITMGGHSSAAAHGNHFQQSYTLQIQRGLEPIFARLGVYHQARNVGMGGLGTIQNALGAQSIYGGDNAILMWDSGMTERDLPSKDLFSRQGFLGGDRVPLITGFLMDGKYDKLVEVGEWNTGFWGAGTMGLPRTETAEQVRQIPYAARFVECSKEMYASCRRYGYNGVCWIKRPDFEPKTEQKPVMGGRAKWHPGNTYHQLTARLFTYNLIKILREALLEWKNADGFALPDEAWHVTDSFQKIKEVVLAQNSNETSECFRLNLPDKVCEVPFSARSEYTPRANPKETSIRSILHPDVDVTGPKPNSYDPPDVYNKALHPPEGEIDYMAIVEGGNDFLPLLQRREYLQAQIHPPERPAPTIVSGLAPGKGWEFVGTAAADNCDGTFDSFCARGADSSCLLYGHNDGRGILAGDALSGWLIMTLNNVQHGTIIVRTEILKPNSVKRTEGWKCENNAATCDNPLEKAPDPSCTDYTFEFAINGAVTKWNDEDYNSKKRNLQRVVQVHVLLDDPTFPKGQDVEVAIRIGGNCGRVRGVGISHIYWA